MFGVLEIWDYVWIAVIVSLFAGGSAAYRYRTASDVRRLIRLEGKLDLVLRQLGLEYTPPSSGVLSQQVKALCADPAHKIAAIKLHREQTGASLAEAKATVEAYTPDQGGGGRAST
jgi:hypothetical protein